MSDDQVFEGTVTHKEEAEVKSNQINDNDWCVLVHLAGLGAYIVPGIGGILITFLIWYLRKDRSPEIDRQGKEALNFELSVFVYAAIASILTFVLVGFVLLPVIAIFHILFSIIAAKAAKDGKDYRYPLTIRVIP